MSIVTLIGLGLMLLLGAGIFFFGVVMGMALTVKKSKDDG